MKLLKRLQRRSTEQRHRLVKIILKSFSYNLQFFFCIFKVLLRWSVQQNISVIPKSKSKEHIYSNIELDFIIPEEDMEVLMGLPQTRYDWDPNTIA